MLSTAPRRGRDGARNARVRCQCRSGSGCGLDWMRFETSGAATGQWVVGNGPRPPTRTARCSSSVVPAIAPGMPLSPDYANCPYVAAFSRASTQIIKDVTAQKNLSFEFQGDQRRHDLAAHNRDLQQRGCRLSGRALLSPQHRGQVVVRGSAPISRASQGRWRLFLLRHWHHGRQYFNTPTQSLDRLATAHPDESVVSRYLIVDTGGAPASGANT